MILPKFWRVRVQPMCVVGLRVELGERRVEVQETTSAQPEDDMRERRLAQRRDGEDRVGGYSIAALIATRSRSLRSRRPDRFRSAPPTSPMTSARRIARSIVCPSSLVLVTPVIVP